MNKSDQYLAYVHTALGTRQMYDSVCYCNRCGMCASVCPSYLQTQQESYSPRGRNQAFRLLLEGKLKLKRKDTRASLQEMVSSCALCGKCTQHCPGKIPTMQHMLELRRRLKQPLLPNTLFYLLRLRANAPALFNYLVKIGLFLRRMGFAPCLAAIPGFSWIKYAHKILPTTSQKSVPLVSDENPSIIYLPSLEAQFFVPQIFEKTYQLANKKYRPAVWYHTPSGLFEYTYGDLRRARQQVRSLINRHARTAAGNLPLVTDNIDVYRFLVQSPQLFENHKIWKEKAQHFAKCMQFVTDIFPKTLSYNTTDNSPAQLFSTVDVELENSPQLQAQKILQTLFKKNFVQCEYKDGIVPPLGYGFVNHARMPEYMLQAVRVVATHQTKTVFVLSAIATLELGLYMRRFYPSAKVCHIVELNG